MVVVSNGRPNRSTTASVSRLSGILIPTVLRPLNALGRLDADLKIKVNGPGVFSLEHTEMRIRYPAVFRGH